MTLSEPSEVAITFTDGRTVRLRRCGVFPDMFASRDGDIYNLALLPAVNHQDNAVIRHRNTSMAVRHLVADAWKPGWEENFRTVVLNDRDNPLDCSIDNLVFSQETHRGRPRSTSLQDEILLARVAILCQDILIAADEAMATPEEVLSAVLKWFPEALIDMEGVPDNWLKSKAAKDLAARASAIERRRQLRAAEARAQRVLNPNAEEQSDA